jgi:hypothetical protein
MRKCAGTVYMEQSCIVDAWSSVSWNNLHVLGAVCMELCAWNGMHGACMEQMCMERSVWSIWNISSVY